MNAVTGCGSPDGGPTGPTGLVRSGRTAEVGLGSVGEAMTS
jgi:hypothetical protein